MPTSPPPGPATAKREVDGDADRSGGGQKRRRRSGSKAGSGARSGGGAGTGDALSDDGSSGSTKSRRGRGRGRGRSDGPELDAATLEQRRGRERNGKPVGRYLMAVHVRPGLTQIAVLEGRSLIEHYVSRPADDVTQIHGNIYIGKVQNVLPGMEAAFVDIAHPEERRALPRRRPVRPRGRRGKGGNARASSTILKTKQMIICQVTKNPIGHKGARLTQEVSLPGPLRGAGARTPRPTASPSACPTTSASASARSSTG